VTKYYKVTEKELAALKAVSDSMSAMSGSCDDSFIDEPNKGVKAIDAILKRAGLERNEDEYVNDKVFI
jgi:hypothetical protein